jgi:uncharacterized protein (TIGR03086 family)
MSTIIDVGPAAAELARVVGGVTDDQLTARTPCEKYSVGDLLEHVVGLSLAFASAAAKDMGPQTGSAPSVDASRLPADWRERIPGQLDNLASAWRDPAAWEGMTRVGGIELPGQVAGLVCANELVVHCWDLARATGQPFTGDPAALQAAHGFLSATAGPSDAEKRGTAFGPVIEVPAGAPLLDRVIGLSGRDPRP